MRFHLTLLALAASVFAAPLEQPNNDLVTRDTNTTYSVLPPDVWDSWREYAHYAGAVYCAPYVIKPWTCYQCKSINPAPRIVATGGENLLSPRWFVANNGSHTILAISGTNSIPMWLLDLGALILSPVDNSYFPGSPPMKLHVGWYGAFKTMAPAVTSAVAESLATAPKLLVVGHSLGAVEGLIFATHLRAKYGYDVTARLFALPRIGDAAWADFVDATLGDRQQHLTHFNDLIPALPFREWGWQHPSGELWIDSIGGDHVRVLPGQENPNGQNSMDLGELIKEGVVNLNLFPQAHIGPYHGVQINPFLCPPPTII